MPYRWLVLGLGVAVAALVLGVGANGETTAGKRSFPKMAKNTYINVTLNNPGSGSGTTKSITLACDPGDKVLSGGFDELDATSAIRTNSPSSGTIEPPHDRWDVAWNSSSTDLVDVFVLCSDFPPRHQP